MRLNKKVFIPALAVLIFMVLAVTIVTFSLADNEGEDGISNETLLAAQDEADQMLTNVDYIIKNSKNSDNKNDTVYHIVELSSSGNPSTLKTLVETQGFRELVLNGNRSLPAMADLTMDEKVLLEQLDAQGNLAQVQADAIEYTLIKASSVVDNRDADTLAKISNADLVYVRNDKDSAAFGTSNDLSEETYNILHTYAVGDYKPLIIDSPTADGNSDVVGETETMEKLTKNYFAASGNYYHTYGWNTSSWNTDYFLSGAIGTDSMFISMQGNGRQAKWQNVLDPNDGGNTYRMANVLVISANGDQLGVASTLNAKLLEDLSTQDVKTGLTYEDASEVTGTVYDFTTDNMKNGLFYKKGYNNRQVKPELVRFTEVKLADVVDEADAANNVNFDNYDMIIIEKDCAPLTMTKEEYKKFVSAMYGGNHIIYDTAMGTASSGGGNTGGNLGDMQKTNYQELFYMVATDKEDARYQNVMITNKNKFDIIAESNSAATLKIIADLINNSSYRGIGGPSSSSTMFTVLEIQPCYPIDTAIAQKKDAYYDQPSEVINNKTKEEIFTKEEIDSIDTSKEYYAWELSPAKIADALNMDASRINVVHMSSEEFACNKTEVLGNYDLVYIGGNTSAFKDIKEFRSLNLLGYPYSNISGVGDISRLPIYSMYSHNGDLVQLSFDMLASGGHKVAEGTPVGRAEYDTDAKANNTFALMNGNDLSYANLESLKAYVDKGMPIVFSTDVSAAYDLIKADRESGSGTGYLQNSIDPDSNLCKLLDYCDAETADGAGSVLWKFDVHSTEPKRDEDGTLGATLAGYVVTFKGQSDNAALGYTCKDDLRRVYDDSSKRPKLAITSKPPQYNLYDETTKLSDKTLTFQFDVTGSQNYEAKLYVDDDGNSVFSSGEVMKDGSFSSSNGELTLSLPSFKGGPVYWRLEIVAHDSNDVIVSTTGTAYIKPDATKKQQINVLQIVPSANDANGKFLGNVDGAQGKISLYFCPECQRAYKRLSYNPMIGGGHRLADNVLYAGSDDPNGSLYGDGKVSGTGGYYTIGGSKLYVGQHEHTFGIVKYDSNLPITNGAGVPTSETGRDDWDWNLADELSDLYDFDLDIMTSREFDELADKIEKHFSDMNFEGMTAEQKATAIQDEKVKAANAKTAYNLFVEGDLQEAEDNLRTVIEHMRDNAGAGSYYGKEFQRLLDEKCYYDFYNIWGTSYLSHYSTDYCTGTEKANGGFQYYYEIYAHAVDKKIALNQAYKEATYYATYATNWISGAYDCVIIGPAENFNNDDLNSAYGLATLKDYVDNDGSVLLFHETLSRFQDAGSAKLTATLRSSFGTDANHMVLDTELINQLGVDKDGSVKYTYNKVETNNLTPRLQVTFADGQSTTCWSTPNISPSAESVSIEYSGNKNGVNMGTYTASGNNSGAHTISIDATFPATGDFTGAKAALLIGWDANAERASGIIGADGKVTFKLPNYSVQSTTSKCYYLPYKAESGYDSNKYFLTNLSYKPTSDTDRHNQWYSDMSQVMTLTGGKYLSTVAFSNSQFISSTSINKLSNPYAYGFLDWGYATLWATGAGANASTAGTNKASQNNSGIVTTYPFTLSDQLNITGTHPSAYALDIEDDDMTVWYSLAGGTYEKKGSALYAASPNDGKDSYFIYSYKNVNFCGAGHTKVTGKYKDNNDERRLYINIICNSVRNSVREPSIDVYDFDSEPPANQIIKPDKTNTTSTKQYIYKIAETVEYPEFMFRVTTDPEETLTSLMIYYDLDYLTTTEDDKNAYNSKEDVLLAEWTDATDLKNLLGSYVNFSKDNQGMDLDKLKLKESYFAPYGGKYTYIVIRAVDSSGNIIYTRIKVEYLPHLFNLT